MAPTYCIVKLFQKATQKRLKRKTIEECQSSAKTPKETRKSNSPCNDTLSDKCRICLKTGAIPIFADDGSSDISEAIQTFGAIPLSPDDHHPKQICDSCYGLLQSAILFRETAGKSHKILTKLVKIEMSEDKGSEPISDIPEFVQKSKVRDSILSKYFDDVETNEYGEIIKITPDGKDLLQMPKVQCRICLKVINKSYYKEHYSVHDAKTVNHICEVCGRGFRLRSAYRTHISTHSTEFPYKCQFCPYKGRHSGLLSTHMRVHIKDYKHKCSECPAKFLTKGNLNKHSLRHKEPLIPCSNCKRMFHTQSLVDKHFEVEHLGIKKHVCNICGKAFGFRKSMMNHQLAIHKREKKLNGRTPSYFEVQCQSSS